MFPLVAVIISMLVVATTSTTATAVTAGARAATAATATAATTAGAPAAPHSAQESGLVRPAAVQALTAGIPSVAISADGRYIAFESRASLTPDDVSPAVDIYVLDRTTGMITLESAPRIPGGAPGDSGHPSISADGRFIVFVSGADLTHDNTPTTDRFPRIFLRDRARGTLRCLSVGVDGASVNGGSAEPVINAAGNIVAFTSQATNLIAAAASATPAAPARTTSTSTSSPSSSIYVWRADTKHLARLDIDALDARASAPLVATYEPSLSADGETMAFTAIVDRFDVSDDASAKRRTMKRRVTRAYVADLRTGAIEPIGCRASPSSRDDGDRGRDFRPVLSADARYVAFVSTASDRVKHDDNATADVFLFDRRTHETQLVSRTPSGRSGNDLSSVPAISGDGRLVAFESRASNLVCERRCADATADRNLVSDIFVFDRDTEAVTRISGAGEPWWDASLGPAIDEVGEVIAFSSARSIGPDDWRGDFDLFTWESRAVTWRTLSTLGQVGAMASRRGYNAPADAAAPHFLRPLRRARDAARPSGASGAGAGDVRRRERLEDARWRHRRSARRDA